FDGVGDGRGPLAEPLAEGLALDVLHHHEVRAVLARGHAHVVDVDDVRMVERGRGARLAVEPVEQLGVGAGTQDLEGHGPPQPGVARAVDLAHAARAQAVDDFVRPDPFSRCQGFVHDPAPLRAARERVRPRPVASLARPSRPAARGQSSSASTRCARTIPSRPDHAKTVNRPSCDATRATASGWSCANWAAEMWRVPPSCTGAWTVATAPSTGSMSWTCSTCGRPSGRRIFTPNASSS